VVIFTGTGDEFLTRMDTSTIGDINTQYWARIHQEGKDLLQNLLEIEVPIIGAVNGPAFIHAELPTLSDIVIASDRASFADKAHGPGGVVPGDGVHVWWPMLLGPNRARHFLLTGDEIGAEEAKRLGFVAEVVPHARVLERAWEVARDLLAKPPLMLRFTRMAMTQHIKRRMLDDLSYGLMLEGMGILSLVGK
jgi:enoyl-CoA hydratase/carnithine racemase